MPFDLTQEATGEGQAQYRALVVGANNAVAWDRLAGGSVADVANANAIGGMLVVHIFSVTDGPGARAFEITLQHKTRVIDAWGVKTGGAGGASDTWQLRKPATGGITAPISLNVADQTVMRTTTIEDNNHILNAGDVMDVNVVKVSGANVACIVYVLCLRVA